MFINATEKEMFNLIQLLDIRLGDKQKIASFDLRHKNGFVVGSYNKATGEAEIDINSIFNNQNIIV